MDTKPAERVSLSTLISYGGVSVPLASVGLPLVIYVTPFYASEIGLPLALIGSLLFFGRITDVITDPLVGFLSDSTRTRFGRRTVWMVAGAIIMMIGVWKVFVPPESATFWYLLVWLGILYLGFTMVGIPYESLSAELSPDYHERTRINGARQTGNLVGLIIATTIPAIILMQSDSPGDVLKGMCYAFSILMVIGIVVFVGGVREPQHVTSRERIGYLDGLKIIGRNKAFVRLSVLMFVANLGESFRITITWFYADDIVGIENIGLLYVYYFGAGLLSIPVWVRLSHAIGKHRALVTAFCIVAVSSALMYFLDYGDRWAFTTLFAVKGFCFGSFQLLPQAMIADIVDIDHLESGKQRQGAYYSINHMLLKFAGAFGQGLSLFLLGIVGYQAAGDNTAQGLLWLKSYFSLVPFFFFGVAAWMVWGYPLTESEHRKIRRQIIDRDAQIEREELAQPAGAS